MVDDWMAFDEKGDPVWKSDDHKALVELCDNFCFADMNAEEVEAHHARIEELAKKLGYAR